MSFALFTHNADADEAATGFPTAFGVTIADALEVEQPI